MTRLEAPQGFKRIVTAGVLTVVCAEVVAIGLAIRVTSNWGPVVPAELQRLRQILWGVTGLQVLIVAYVIFFVVTLVQTVLQYDQTGIILDQPFKRWMGSWTAVQRVYLFQGSLCVETAGGHWSVRMSPHALPVLQDFRSHLPPGVWLEERQARRYVIKKVLPIFLILTVIGAVALAVIGSKLSTVRPSPPSSLEQREAVPSSP